MRKSIEPLLQCHNSARKGLEFALARPFHHHGEAFVDLHCLPGPLGDQNGVKSRFQELVAAPPGPLTLLSQGAPCMAKCCAHGVVNDQLIKDFAIQRDFRELAAVFGTQLIDMHEAFYSCNR